MDEQSANDGGWVVNFVDQLGVPYREFKRPPTETLEQVKAWVEGMLEQHAALAPLQPWPGYRISKTVKP